MGDDLGVKSRERGEASDRNGTRAVNQVPIRDRGVFANNQFRVPICLMREMSRWTKRESGYPIAAADCCMRFEIKKLEVLANSCRPDARFFLHYEMVWKHPRQTNARSRMNLKAELLFQKRSTQFPGQ